jgi:Zn finger protein HypA/HybF involved in hydrogenase expression
MPMNGVKCTGVECMVDNDDFDVQCQECETWVSVKETDERDYCKDCQNPEYDPVWPMGD